MIGRNDPCPCGSGRKYKNCHLALDDEERHSWQGLRLEPGGAGLAPRRRNALPPPSEIGGHWEIAVDAIPITFDDDLDARPVMVLVAAGRLALHVNMLQQAPGEPAELGALVTRELRFACEIASKLPATVTVRDASIARAIAAELEIQPLALGAPPPIVRASHALAAADEARRSLMTFLAPTAPADSAHISRPRRWAGWGLPPDVVRRLHAAAAAFYRGAAWAVLADDEPLLTTGRLSSIAGPDAATGSLDSATAVVMGNAGVEFGLSLYANTSDLDALYDRDETQADAPPPESILRPEGVVLTLTLGSMDDMDPAMRREVRAAGWEIAGPRAWPQLIVLGTPGGGVTAAQVEAMIARLEAIPRFVGAHRSVLHNDAPWPGPIRWHDQETGIDITFAGADGGELESPWDPPATLSPAGPEGPKAQPGVLLSARDDAEWRAAINSTMEPYVRVLNEQRPSLRTAERRVEVVGRFVTFVLAQLQVPIEAVTEHDLRQFLYSFWPAIGDMSAHDTSAVLPALRHFFSVMPAAYGVRCPWAKLVLADREAFLERWRSRPVEPCDDEELDEYSFVFTDDLVAREMMLPNGDEIGMHWSAAPTDAERAVLRVAHRQWLMWRDEVIRSGTTAPAAVHDGLVPRLRAWFDAPHPMFGGATPRAATKVRRRAKRREGR